jgi:hypothetical protein
MHTLTKSLAVCVTLIASTLPNFATEPAAAPTRVDVSRGPGLPAKATSVRLLTDLAGFTPDAQPPALSRFGGDLAQRGEATGFFRVERKGARWWMVDPEGYHYFNTAVNTVRATTTGSAIMQASLKEKFGDRAGWANATSALLRENGFNGVGAWSDHDDLNAATQRLPYTLMLDLMKSYARNRNGLVKVGDYMRFMEGVPFVFDPEFEGYCRKRMESFSRLRDDPWMVGVFSDNELPWPRDALDRYLQLPSAEAGHKAAQSWRKARYGGAEAEHQPEITDEERDAFLSHVLDRYFSTVNRVIKETLPHHLYLGSRLHGRSTFNEGVWEAVAPHVDVISANVYFQWTPPVERLRETVNRINKPFIVTEWYAKGMDTNLPNITGAGWLVPTQADRGRFYQHFVLSLLETEGCVGSHWFCYMDNDPADTSTDASNRDSNKGMVNTRHEPYTALAADMKKINDQKYRLIKYFDQLR